MALFTHILLFFLQYLCSPSKLLFRDLKLGLKEAVPGEESLTDRERGVQNFSLALPLSSSMGVGTKVTQLLWLGVSSQVKSERLDHL